MSQNQPKSFAHYLLSDATQVRTVVKNGEGKNSFSIMSVRMFISSISSAIFQEIG